MIDYIKIRLVDYSANNLLNNLLLNFGRNINENSGEIINTNNKGKEITPHRIAYFQGLTFKVYDTGSIYISGSIHKYYYNGLHNFNDFGINELNIVLKDLKEKFNLQTKQCRLVNIELGVNIQPPIETNEILKRCLLHKTKPFEYQKNSDEGKYIQCEHTQYWVKKYDKRLHYQKNFDIENDILRFELKFNRMEYFNKKGVYTLKDLLKHGLHNFKERILLEWNNVLHYENNLIEDKVVNLEYGSLNYWLELKKDNFNYHRKKLNKLIQENPNNIKVKVNDLISEKIDLLNSNTTQNDTLCIMSNHVVSKSKKCLITGYDISMQKENSLLLSHKGLRYYKEKHYRIYKEIERVYLTKFWNGSTDEVKIKEIAHNIRNKYYNNTINPNQLRMVV